MSSNYELFMSSVRKGLEDLIYRAYSAGRMNGEETTSLRAEKIARDAGADAVADAIKTEREMPF